MSTSVLNVLTIAGSDPSGGAGIQADLRTFASLGVHGCAALTALTAQNARAVTGVMAVPDGFITKQLEAVFSAVPIHAVKIGMLGTASAVQAVATALRVFGPSPVVLDPVLRATTGAALLADDALVALREELIPLVSLITPNAIEAGILLGIAAPRTVQEARQAARQLASLGCGAVLVTGGHLDDPQQVVDVLDDAGVAHELRMERLGGASVHGTGCVHSSAIAALLARGSLLPAACAEAQRVVAEAIRWADDLRMGSGSRVAHPLAEIWRSIPGPVNVNDGIALVQIP